MLFSLVETAAVEQDEAQNQLDDMVAVVQSGGLPCKFIGLLLGLLPEVPQVATPFVEIGERQAGIGAAVLRVDLKGYPEILRASLSAAMVPWRS